MVVARLPALASSGALGAALLWGCASPEPSPTPTSVVASRNACPGVISAIEAADHVKAAAAAVQNSDTITAAAEAQRARTASARSTEELRGIPDGPATEELRGQLAKLAVVTGQGIELLADPSLKLDGDTIATAQWLAQTVRQREGFLARAAAATTCPAS